MLTIQSKLATQGPLNDVRRPYQQVHGVQDVVEMQVLFCV